MAACGPDADIWGEDDNARLYDAFARQHPIYRDTSRDLIALARLSANAAVLDLACGTGVTSREILAALGPAGKVIGADRSAAMLAAAARATADPRITWVQSPAETIDRHVTAPADPRIHLPPPGQRRLRHRAGRRVHLPPRCWRREGLAVVPVFTKYYLPGLPYQDRMHILAKTYTRLGTEQPEPSRWVAFGARARR
jgi:hypothetical protein